MPGPMPLQSPTGLKEEAASARVGLLNPVPHPRVEQQSLGPCVHWIQEPLKPSLLPPVSEYYPNCEVVFMGMANIHSIRKSFQSLRFLCTQMPDPAK